MRRVRNNRARLERNRYSIFTDDLKTCYICGRPATDLHEIIYGSNRLNSMKYGFVLPLCRQHHFDFHNNHVLTRRWCKACQEYYEKKYNHKDWLDTFHKNYK